MKRNGIAVMQRLIRWFVALMQCAIRWFVALTQPAIRWFNEFRLILWVCRVSVTSVVLGWTLFLFVPQARDLFIDLPAAKEWYLTWAYALLVAIALLVFWAFPVCYAARKALDDPHWLKPTEHGL